MTRILIAIAVAASGISLWAVSAKSADWENTGYFNHAVENYRGAYYQPVLHWPNIGHEPAITKTVTPSPNGATSEVPAPVYNYEWQRQPALSAPTLAHPQFSHPQQGFYPRDEINPQIAPGYEYDFGESSSPPSYYPIEGAGWRERSYQQPLVEYAHCPL